LKFLLLIRLSSTSNPLIGKSGFFHLPLLIVESI